MQKTFDNHCPVCNNADIDAIEDSDYKYFTCDSCKTNTVNITSVEFIYFGNIFTNIIICFESENSQERTYNISNVITEIIHLDDDHSQIKQILNHVPSFSSIQDLISIIDTLRLFQ